MGGRRERELWTMFRSGVRGFQAPYQMPGTLVKARDANEAISRVSGSKTLEAVSWLPGRCAVSCQDMPRCHLDLGRRVMGRQGGMSITLTDLHEASSWSIGPVTHGNLTSRLRGSWRPNKNQSLPWHTHSQIHFAWKKYVWTVVVLLLRLNVAWKLFFNLANSSPRALQVCLCKSAILDDGSSSGYLLLAADVTSLKIEPSIIFLLGIF